MEPEKKLTAIDGSLFMHGDNGDELQIHVGDSYHFNDLYTITNANVVENEQNNPHYFFELRLNDVSTELQEMICDRFYFDSVIEYLASYGDEDEIAEELEKIALRGPIRNVEIYVDDNNEILIIEHRDLGEMDYLTGFDDKDYLEREEYTGNLKEERKRKMNEYNSKREKEIIEWEDKRARAREEEKEDDPKPVKEEKKPKENVIEMEMEKEKKEAK